MIRMETQTHHLKLQIMKVEEQRQSEKDHSGTDLCIKWLWRYEMNESDGAKDIWSLTLVEI